MIQDSKLVSFDKTKFKIPITSTAPGGAIGACHRRRIAEGDMRAATVEVHWSIMTHSEAVHPIGRNARFQILADIASFALLRVCELMN